MYKSLASHKHFFKIYFVLDLDASITQMYIRFCSRNVTVVYNSSKYVTVESLLNGDIAQTAWLQFQLFKKNSPVQIYSKLNKENCMIIY